MLLDTCVVQNIEWVWDRMEENVEWTDERVAELESQFGAALANEILDLGHLVEHLQWEGFPWLVSASARSEFEQHAGSKRPGLLKGWSHLHGHQEDWQLSRFGA